MSTQTQQLEILEQYPDNYGLIVKKQDREDFGTIDKPDLTKEHRRISEKAVMVGLVVFALGYLWASARVNWFK
jgi:hypothetical protein